MEISDFAVKFGAFLTSISGVKIHPPDAERDIPEGTYENFLAIFENN
jgi:hypothetical protein